MIMLDRRTASILFTSLCFVLVVGAIYCARQVILIFILAILFTHLLEPVVHFLQRHSLFFRDLRGPAVVETYLASVILIAFMIFGFVPGVTNAPATLVQSAAASLDDLGNGNVIASIGNQNGWAASQTQQLKQFIVGHRAQIHGMVENIESGVPSVLGGLALVPILAIFFLRDGRIIARAAVCVVAPWGHAETLQGIIDEVAIVLRTYMRTQVNLALSSLVFYWAVLLLFRFPHAIALGLLGAGLEFIPVAGWMITAAVILIMGVFTQSSWIWVGVLLLIWRGVQDYVNVPRVMGKHLRIHPLLSIFGIMVGYEIGGVIGVFFSVPVMAVTGVIWRRLTPPLSQTTV
ncbi:AI-2E family transporter [Acidicapsa ligni]|uniref:AI-2E family transporter n=1 Tax=Acidicapsa ligni TaxID=542300 RepID=UPI0021E04CF2|nr:AI-2E family transporter [Acidicapsa ligni]